MKRDYANKNFLKKESFFNKKLNDNTYMALAILELVMVGIIAYLIF